MNKIEVDPRLFITCRLCLEELGVYQIAPLVKEQIAYCFDINVEPFDGLPQLICKKCEAILTNFAATKKTFFEKQNDLRSKIIGPQNGHVKLSQNEPDHLDSLENLEKNDGNPCTVMKRKDASISNSSHSEYDRNNDQSPTESNNDETPESWSEKFTKHYVCRICNLRWSTVKSLKSHINSRHKTLKRKYSYIFKRHCEVKLYATDGKPNVTGSKRRVMHDKNKIIENIDSTYYITYTAKDYEDKECTDKYDREERSLKTKKRVINQYYESSDSSDYDIVIPKSKRVRRICSRSSNETVILDTANKSNTSDDKLVQVGECINIDDSTDSDSEIPQSEAITEDDVQDPSSSKELEPHQSTINEIINVCQTKYINKHYLDDSGFKSKDPSDIAKQLKRKILSIGRKVINKKKGVSCTPLLRFMELKNLDITWISRPMLYDNQESSSIRIMTRLKNTGENVDSETGWTDYPSPSNLSLAQILSNLKGNNNVAMPDKESITVPNGTSPGIPQEETLDSAVLIVDANITAADTKKLLNENPVANPKQLPKKSVSELKAVKVTASKPSLPNIEVTPEENNDFELCMPIITSTTSLAPPFQIEDNHDASHNVIKNANSKNDVKKSDVPRIKVKPVSELMSAETLNRMHDPNRASTVANPPLLDDNMLNIFTTQISPVPQIQNAVSVQINNGLISPEPPWKNEIMILDTIDLPNTKTNSPFEYFKKLLQMHNIVLLNTNVDLSSEYHCLIKFKVLYKQESNHQPVILCLALYCSKNVFCMKVKDRNQENINLSRISPNWQWEVLKIYKGEVVNKLMSNAQKLGQDVHEYTKTFVCLLKSINLIKL